MNFRLKYCEKQKITGKAVLENLNRKIFLTSQPLWPTGFLRHIPTDYCLKFEMTAKKKWNYLITMTVANFQCCTRNIFDHSRLL